MIVIIVIRQGSSNLSITIFETLSCPLMNLKPLFCLVVLLKSLVSTAVLALMLLSSSHTNSSHVDYAVPCIIPGRMCKERKASSSDTRTWATPYLNNVLCELLPRLHSRVVAVGFPRHTKKKVAYIELFIMHKHIPSESKYS